jgi:hypothetical protein
LALKILKECISLVYDFAKSLQQQEPTSKEDNREKIVFSKTSNKFVQLLGMLLDNLNEDITIKKVRKYANGNSDLFFTTGEIILRITRSYLNYSSQEKGSSPKKRRYDLY